MRMRTAAPQAVLLYFCTCMFMHTFISHVSTHACSTPVEGIQLFSLDGQEEILDVPSYTLRMVSPQNFESFNASLVVLNPESESCPRCIDACQSIRNPELLKGKAVLFSTDYCDAARPLGKIKEAGAVAAIELFGSFQDSSPFDSPPRFALPPKQFNVSNSDDGMVVQRVHGKYPAIVLRQALNCYPDDLPPDEVPRPEDVSEWSRLVGTAVEPNECKFQDSGNTAPEFLVEINFKLDRWYELQTSAHYVLYLVGQFLFFVCYLGQHSIRALLLMKHNRQLSSDSVDLQVFMMVLLLGLAVLNMLDIFVSTLRDYGQIWVPELITQLTYAFTKLIAVIAVLLLNLFWMELVRTTRTNVRMLGAPNQRRLKIMTGALSVAVIILVSLWSFKVEGYTFIRTATVGAAGIVVLGLSVGVFIYGGNILRQLQGKSVADLKNRGGSSTDPASKAAAARIRPLARLVMGSSGLLLLVSITAATTVFTRMENSPGTYWIPFWVLLLFEGSLFALIIHAMSPIYQAKRQARRETVLSEHIAKQEASSFVSPGPAAPQSEFHTTYD